MALPQPYLDLCRLSRESATLGSVAQLLNWDQETYMPSGAAAHPAGGEALLAGRAPGRGPTPGVGELIAACEADKGLSADPMCPAGAAVREFRRDYDLATRL